MNTQGQALLIMDLQDGILGNYPDAGAGLIPVVNAAIARARSASVPVIFVRVAFRAGAPELSTDSKFGAAMKARVATVDPTVFTALHAQLDVRPDDLIVEKRRFSAFAGSDLEVLLRGLGIRNLVLGGVSTSGVVLSTVREASDKDFGLTVLSDCCLDPDEEVHRVLLGKVFPRQADVMESLAWNPSGH